MLYVVFPTKKEIVFCSFDCYHKSMLWKQKRDMKVTKYIIQFVKQLLHAVICSISNMYSLYDLFDFERSQFQRLCISLSYFEESE